ncbi:MAG: maleate cis-trans isomerase family protein [Micromonosporaceae bacterium]
MDVHSSTWRTRLGILVVHNDPVPEVEIWSMAPPGVTVHTARFESPKRPGIEYVGSPWGAMLEAPDVARGIEQLARLGTDAICLCFGSSSFFGGAEFDAGFAADATRAAGVPVFTAAQAMTAALRDLDVSNPLVVMPPWFTTPTYQATTAYLMRAGFGVAGLVGFELGEQWREMPAYEIFDAGGRWTVRPEDVHDQVRRGFPSAADGVLLPGSGFRSREAIEPLERDLGVPVVTSNQACMWQFLRISGSGAIVDGGGRLLRHVAASRSDRTTVH